MGEMVMLKVVDVYKGKMSNKVFKKKLSWLKTDLASEGWKFGDITDGGMGYRYLIFSQKQKI
jgi:hypothetical protein